MKVTTVRFSQDLWDVIAMEAALAGISASEFIREAARARAAAAAGARGDMPFTSFSSAASELGRASDWAHTDQRAEIQDALAKLSRAMAGTIRSDAEALRAQSHQARRVAERETRRADKPPKQST
jgi:hypothetical protein